MFRISSAPRDGWETVKNIESPLRFLIAANTLKEERELLNKRPFNICVIVFDFTWIPSERTEYHLMQYLASNQIGERAAYLSTHDSKVAGILCRSTTLTAMACSVEAAVQPFMLRNDYINTPELTKIGNIFNVRFHEIT